MGLWMKQERMPAVVRVLRLIASSADCLGHYQICRVIYGGGAPGDLQALRDHMMAIVRLPATPERSLWSMRDFGNSARGPSSFEHCYPLGSDRQQGKSPADGMGRERSQVFGPHRSVVARDFLVIAVIA
jgi:hypothetical protein